MIASKDQRRWPACPTNDVPYKNGIGRPFKHYAAKGCTSGGTVPRNANEAPKKQKDTMTECKWRDIIRDPVTRARHGHRPRRACPVWANDAPRRPGLRAAGWCATPATAVSRTSLCGWCTSGPTCCSVNAPGATAVVPTRGPVAELLSLVPTEARSRHTILTEELIEYTRTNGDLADLLCLPSAPSALNGRRLFLVALLRGCSYLRGAELVATAPWLEQHTRGGRVLAPPCGHPDLINPPFQENFPVSVPSAVDPTVRVRSHAGTLAPTTCDLTEQLLFTHFSASFGGQRRPGCVTARRGDPQAPPIPGRDSWWTRTVRGCVRACTRGRTARAPDHIRHVFPFLLRQPSGFAGIAPWRVTRPTV